MVSNLPLFIEIMHEDDLMTSLLRLLFFTDSERDIFYSALHHCSDIYSNTILEATEATTGYWMNKMKY